MKNKRGIQRLNLGLTLAILLCLNISAKSNMASPVTHGTRSAAPFTSKYARVVSEHIVIKPDALFQTARFIITYTIEVSRAGRQVPMLFVAEDYSTAFSVMLDGRGLQAHRAPDSTSETLRPPWTDFLDIFPADTAGQNSQVTVRWNEYESSGYALRNLHYFEADIQPGRHIIEVAYTTRPSVDQSGWLKEYSIDYSLSPAAYWKNFGTLTVELHTAGLPLTLNTGKPHVSEGPVQKWFFNKLPGDHLQLLYRPHATGLAAILIWLGPGMLALLSILPLALLHLLWLRRLQRKRPARKHWLARLAGILLLPFIYCFLYMRAFNWIDAAIGPEAGRYHGYTFIIFMLYPLILGIYIILTWMINWLLNKAAPRAK